MGYQRRRVIKLTSYALLSALAGCTISQTRGQQTEQPQPSSTATRTINLGISKFGAVLNVIRAQKTLEPRLAAIGVNLEWKEFSAGPQLMEALGVGSVDVTYTGEPPPIFAQASGTPIVYLAQEEVGPASVGVLVPKGSSIKSVADLKGKRVAMSKATNSQYLVARALEQVGLTLNDIEPAYLPPADGRIAFDGGRVDAWSTWDPFMAVAELAVNAQLILDGKGFLPNSGFYLTSKAFADQNADIIRVILEGVQSVSDRSMA